MGSTEQDKYDELIKEIRVETDSEKRIDLMHQAEDMLMDTWAVVPIYEYNDMYMEKSAGPAIMQTSLV